MDGCNMLLSLGPALYRISSHALEQDVLIQFTSPCGRLTLTGGQGGDPEEGRRREGAGRLSPMFAQFPWLRRTTRQMDFSGKRGRPSLHLVGPFVPFKMRCLKPSGISSISDFWKLLLSSKTCLLSCFQLVWPWSFEVIKICLFIVFKTFGSLRQRELGLLERTFH